MKLQFILPIIAVIFGVLVGTRLNCGNGKPTKPETILVHDTLRLKADTVYANVNHYVIRNAQGEEIHDTTLLLRIDTVLKSEGVKEFTACADTVVIDTFHVCYNYIARRFDMIIDFAPRSHDTLVTIPPKRSPFLQGSPFAVVDVDLNQNVFGGIGYAITILNHLELAGSVGLNRSPFQATAHVQGRWNF